MKYTRLCLLNYNLVKDYKVCFLDYNLKKENYKALFPKFQSKRKDKALSTNQNLDLGARLWNKKMLGAHPIQTESGLLNSN